MLAMDSAQSLSFQEQVVYHMWSKQFACQQGVVVNVLSGLVPCMQLEVSMAQSCSQDSLHAQGDQAANVVICILSLAPSVYLRNGCGGVKLCQLHIPVPH